MTVVVVVVVVGTSVVTVIVVVFPGSSSPLKSVLVTVAVIVSVVVVGTTVVTTFVVVSVVVVGTSVVTVIVVIFPDSSSPLKSVLVTVAVIVSVVVVGTTVVTLFVVVSVVVVGTIVVTTSVVVSVVVVDTNVVTTTVCSIILVITSVQFIYAASTPLIPKFREMAASITNIVKKPDLDAPFWRLLPRTRRPIKCIENRVGYPAMIALSVKTLLWQDGGYPSADQDPICGVKISSDRIWLSSSFPTALWKRKTRMRDHLVDIPTALKDRE